MKIKRFEASNMTDALRKIKKEFGEDAVILSAKTLKKTSLLGKQKSGQVVVTAAIDRAPTGPVSRDVDIAVNPAAAESQVIESTDPGHRSSINILKRFNPITITGQKKVKPKIVELMNANKESKKQRYVYDLLVSHGLSESIANDLERKTTQLLPQDNASAQDYLNNLAQVMEAMEMFGPVRNKNKSKQRIVVMLGPSGVGKTSAAAKLCAKHTIQLGESAALISFDNQRAAGTVELERYARILDVPFKTIFDHNDVNAVMTEMSSYDLVIIDTPGFSSDDQILCEQIRRLISALDEPERYLLISADAQEKAMAKVIDFYRPLGVQALFFTKLDWAVDIGPMINQADASNLPIAYLSCSPKVPDGLQVATALDLARRIMPADSNLSESGEDPAVTVIRKPDTIRQGAYYVANRNSDIFHLNDCKSVQRINTDNMIVFKDPSEAMGRQFKPCRMCCSELIFPKPIDRLARGYAGRRYYHQ